VPQKGFRRILAADNPDGRRGRVQVSLSGLSDLSDPSDSTMQLFGQGLHRSMLPLLRGALDERHILHINPKQAVFSMKQNGKVLELLMRFEEMGIPSIDCIICHRGKRVFRHQSGFSDEARTKRLDGSERYNIYSCSKPITCTAALQLVEQGMLRLDDAVYEYLPEFRKMKKRNGDKLETVQNTMTIRHLFTMTAGLSYNTNSENLQLGKKETQGRMPTRTAMQYLARDPLGFEPGTQWQYSLCHDVLAAVVEVVSGERFGIYVKKNIFDRLGMKHSTFLLPEDELNQIAAQYRYDPETQKFNACGPQIQTFKLGTEYESGGAGCISSAADYSAFLEGLRSGERLLRRDTIAQMSSPQISETVAQTFTETRYSYGLGVRCPKPGMDTQDFGWGGAAGAYLSILPDAEASIFHVQHVITSPNQGLRSLFVDALLQDLQS
jgi:CubicO group peptidase (beta-lactamase class C family)